MFHSRDSPRLLVCDTGLYMEQNDIGFITVAICGGYISKYPRLKSKRDGYLPWNPTITFLILMCIFRHLRHCALWAKLQSGFAEKCTMHIRLFVSIDFTHYMFSLQYFFIFAGFVFRQNHLLYLIIDVTKMINQNPDGLVSKTFCDDLRLWQHHSRIFHQSMFFNRSHPYDIKTLSFT